MTDTLPKDFLHYQLLCPLESPLQLAWLFPTERKSCRNTHRKTRRTKQVYSYYSNSVATTRLILQGGDIEINPGPDVDHSLSLCLLNARSVRNKTAMLVDYLCDSTADLIFTLLRKPGSPRKMLLCGQSYTWIVITSWIIAGMTAVVAVLV